MHALVVTVRIEPSRFDIAQKTLREQVVPRVSQTPGFVKGYWTVNAETTQGLSMAVFSTKKDAENAVDMVRAAAPPPGVTLNTVEVREVVAEGTPLTT
jgi:hypothetical protein